ncbi:MAG TPA: hypothetical protein VHZ28_04300 [Terracidiphilus sp.]|jgi:hypothetical protein|nr:hypothetical protein [Terracidiphilus sp.]
MLLARVIVLALFGTTLGWIGSTQAAHADAPVAIDSDHDGLSDVLEQDLLERFAPRFQADPHDCAGTPASFEPGMLHPVVAAEDGTVYGVATPRTLKGFDEPLVELRYFHLWKTDCGRMGHPLDTEHVSVLIEKNGDAWDALYWYAAAHEDTVCDASQITRASTLDAKSSGAAVWVSRGKHASFLNQQLCQRGCGGDRCGAIEAMNVSRIVNLGEAQSPMNGSLWIASTEWPFAAKLARSDFNAEELARLERLPATDIAWVNPGKRPAQATIAAGGSTADALAMSDRKTDTAISLAGDATGNALETTYSKVTRSLKTSAHNVGCFLKAGCGAAKKEPAGQMQNPHKP